MPTEKETLRDYLLKVNQSIDSLNKRVTLIERKINTIRPGSLPSQEQDGSQAPLSRRQVGWLLIWIPILLYVTGFMWGYGLAGSILGSINNFFPIAIIAGIVLVIMSPKKDAGQGQEKPSKSAALREKPELEDEAEKRQKSVSKPRAQARTPPQPQKKSTSFEEDIGKVWLPRIGIFSLIIGIAFFVVYAIQNKWIGPTAQIAIGIVSGIILLCLGEHFHRKGMGAYGMTLVSGGFGIIYFSLFAAHKVYDLIAFHIGVAALAIVIICAVIFALRYDSLIIAAGAFVLGYVVPHLLSSMDTFFLIYAFALTLGACYVSIKKQWLTLGAGSVVAMYYSHFLWLDVGYSPNLVWLHILLTFAYIALFGHLVFSFKEGAQKNIDFLQSRGTWVGIILALSYAMLFVVNAPNLHFLHLFVPLIALLGVVLFFGLRFQWDVLLIGSVVLTYLLHFTWIDNSLKPEILPLSFGATLAFFLAFTLSIILRKEAKKGAPTVIALVLNSALFYAINLFLILRFEKGYEGIFTACLGVFHIMLAYLSYSQQVKRYMSSHLALACGFVALAIPLQLNKEWVTISWAVMSVVLVWLSFRLKEDVVRFASSGAAILSLGRLLSYDTALPSKGFDAILSSTRSLVFAITIACFYLVAWLYIRNKSEFENFEGYIRYVAGAFAGAATILMTFLIWLEISSTASMAPNAQRLWISLALIIQGIALLSIGFAKSIKYFRLMGLSLLGLAILKVFFYDLSNLETGYRIISFIVLGVILLISAYAYNRFKEYI